MDNDGKIPCCVNGCNGEMKMIVREWVEDGKEYEQHIFNCLDCDHIAFGDTVIK